MNTLRTLSIASLVFFFAATNLFAQSPDHIKSLEFKLQLMADNTTWGVFVRPDNTISPSNRTMAGSGQVTLVAPAGFTYSNFKNFGGTWIENARVNSPTEAPGKSYISFGFVTDEPRIKLATDKETLLFTFTTDAFLLGNLSLIDNDNDPFATPNSYDSNPGNDLGIIDLGNPGGMFHYIYARNYGTAPVVAPTEILASRNE